MVDNFLAARCKGTLLSAQATDHEVILVEQLDHFRRLLCLLWVPRLSTIDLG